MGEPPTPEDRPGQAGNSNQPWNKEEFLDFLRRQDPDLEDESADSPLDTLDYRLQEKIMNEFEIFSALSEEIEGRAVDFKDKLTGDKLRLLSSLMQTQAELSDDVVKDAALFRNGKISGEQLAERYHEVAIIYPFLHRHVVQLTKTVV